MGYGFKSALHSGHRRRDPQPFREIETEPIQERCLSPLGPDDAPDAHFPTRCVRQGVSAPFPQVGRVEARNLLTDYTKIWGDMR
jgi:hypothetical protein